MIYRTLFVIVLLGAATFLVARKISKLPSKYERAPKVISSWSALDKGIDPTEDSNTDIDASQP